MQLRVIMYIKSKKSAVFVLRVICTYKQSLNELQQHDLTGRLWNQQHILLCYTAMSGNIAMIFSNDWFVNVICSLVLWQHFHFLKIPKTDVIYVLRTGVGMRIKNQYFNVYPLCCVTWIRHWLSLAYVGCVSGGEGPKMINQCVRTASCAYCWIRHCLITSLSIFCYRVANPCMRDYGRIVDKSIGTLHIYSADKIKALSFKLQLQVGTFLSLGVI